MTIKRHTRTNKTTIGNLSLEECGFLCNTLEPKDRGLTKDMPLEEIKKRKVAGATALPTGEYEVKLMLSPSMKDKPYAKKYGGLFPVIIGTPGFSGAMMHPGNNEADTRACPLLGVYDPKKPDYISSSVKAYEDLMDFYLWPAHLRGDKMKLRIE